MRLLKWLRLRWWIYSSLLRYRWLSRRSTTDLFTPAGQHQQQTEAEKWKAEHGFSPGGETAPWDDDMRAHNAKVTAEYQAELDKRQFEYRILGTYTPRYGRMVPTRMGPILLVAARVSTPSGWLDDWHELSQMGDTIFEVSWDLEMTLRPGARVDVTGLGKVQPTVSDEVFHQQRQIGDLTRRIHAEEMKESLS